MQRYKTVYQIAAAVAMLAVILDSATALTGGIQGVNLCIYTVIPSLFPLFVLSNYLTSLLHGTSLGFLKRLAKLCGVPCGGESLLLVGLIGGYPVGAQCVKNAYDNGIINKTDCQRLLGFCNNAGPAFIFGMTSNLFASPLVPWVLWIIQILSAMITGMVLPDKRNYAISQNRYSNVSFIDAVKQSVIALSGVCGWVILFRVITTMLTKWFLWYLPTEIKVIFYGIMELVNGCTSLFMISEEALRMILCSMFLSAGGLCVCMQTMSVVGELGIHTYLKGKMIQVLISGMLSSLVGYILFPGNSWMMIIAVLLTAGFALWFCFNKKSVAFPGKMIYNIKKSL